MIRLLLIPIVFFLAAQTSTPSIEDAHEALDAWDLTTATNDAKKRLWEEPENRDAQLFAARVQHQRGNYESALSLIRATPEPLSKSVEELESRTWGSLRWMSQAKEIKTPHFIIRYRGKDEIAATYAVDVLEASLRNIGQALGYQHASNAEPIVVEFYPDAFGLADATGLTIREIQTTGTIAICKYHRVMITSPLAASAGYGWADTLAHELTHLIIAKTSRNHVPIWLHEGIAKYFETAWRSKPGEALEPYGEKLLRKAVEKNNYVTFAQMHPSMAKLPSQEKAALAFAEVFTVLEFLQKRYPQDKIGVLLRNLGENSDMDAALKATFGFDLKTLETHWHAYLKTRPFRDVAGAKPSIIRLSDGSNNTADAAPMEDLVDAEAKDAARLGELLQLRGHQHSAMRKYEKAYAKVGARYPTLNHRLARAYLETGMHDKAQHILQASLKLHTEDVDALLLSGQLEQKLGNNAAAIARFENLRLFNPYIPALHDALVLLYEKTGRSAALIAREKRFSELTKTPPTPTEPANDSTSKNKGTGISFIQAEWKPIRIDNGPLKETPLWNQILTPGTHKITYTGANGQPITQEIQSTPNALLVRLP